MSEGTSTDRLYFAAQEAFRSWCRNRGVTFPAPHRVAAYLAECGRQRGPTAVPVHLSAIARLYRAANRPLDTKSAAIQRVVGPAREQAKARQKGNQRGAIR